MRPRLPHPRASARRSRRGFTLLELMVSLTIGGLAISAMYAIGSTVMRQYHQQHQAANALTTLRIALTQVKRDLARAGFLATPNLVPGAPHASLGCATNYAEHAPSPGSGALAGISIWNDNICITGSTCSNVIPECAGCSNANPGNGFTADSVVLFGNYETASEYSGLQLISSTTVSVGRSSHAYQTDFTTWYNTGNTDTWDGDAFNRVFAPGRMIRIRTSGGLYHFATIVNGGVTAQDATNDARITFSPAIPDACRAGTDGGYIAPVSAIRYFPRNDPNPPPNAEAWGPMAQLVREEVQPGNKATPLALTEPSDVNYQYTNTRVVLDYLVAFNLGFVMKPADVNVGDADNYVPGTDTATPAQVNANPERVRAITIELAARTPEQDRTFPFGANCAALGCYQVWTNRPGASRVRTLRAEVFVPNIAFEGF